MKLEKIKNKKASEIGGEAVVVTSIVIIVLILGTLFLFRSNIDSWMKNLPGFTGPGDEDKETGIDLPTIFDCKYPIGYAPITEGEREIKLLDLHDVEETEFKDIEEKLKETEPTAFLKFDVDDKLKYVEFENYFFGFGGSESTLGTVEKQYGEDSKLDFWRKIIFEDQFKNFIFKDGDNSLPGLEKEPISPVQLKKDLRLLYNARYYPNPGWICGDEQNIKSLKEAGECIESCEIYGGECKTVNKKETDEFEIEIANCIEDTRCYVKIGEKLTEDYLSFSNIQADTYKTSNINSIEPDDVVSILYGTLDFSEMKGGTSFKFGLKETNSETLCYFIRTNKKIIRAGEYNFLTSSYLDKKSSPFTPDLRKKNEDIFLISVFSPIDQKNIYKVVNGNPFGRVETSSPSIHF